MPPPGDRPDRTGPLVMALADGPWGPARIAAGARGVVALELLSSPEAFEAGLARRGFGRPVPLEAAPAGTAADLAGSARDLVAAMLEGESVDLGALPVDIADRSAWDRLVLEAVRAIPRGTVASYGEVARRIGRTGAARAVGGAVGRNPVGLLVPCHRVIAGDGTLGGYGVAAWGGREAALAVKRELLALEGVRLDRAVPYTFGRSPRSGRP
jgi:methylated-DNA-[protein]-cysteine S-methyltransferase